MRLDSRDLQTPTPPIILFPSIDPGAFGRDIWSALKPTPASAPVPIILHVIHSSGVTRCCGASFVGLVVEAASEVIVRRAQDGRGTDFLRSALSLIGSRAPNGVQAPLRLFPCRDPSFSIIAVSLPVVFQQAKGRDTPQCRPSLTFRRNSRRTSSLLRSRNTQIRAVYWQ